MKKLLITAAALSLTAGAALAADLPSRKAAPILPPPPPPPLWTGFYAGLNAGYNFGTNDRISTAAFGTPFQFGVPGIVNIHVDNAAALAQSGNASNDQSGFIGGGQIGYNFQWGQNFVVGIETDIQGTGVRSTSNTIGAGVTGWNGNLFGFIPVGLQQTAIGGTTVNAGLDFLGTVRGRLGYLFTPTMLLYATGGFTYGNAYANVTSAAATTWNASIFGVGLPFALNQTYFGGGNRSELLTGWNVGGGIEWMFMPNWSLKAEGIYWNMGSQNVPTASFGPAPVVIGGGGFLGQLGQHGTTFSNTRVNYQGVIARVGVNYHLHWFDPAPVVAKY